MDEDNNSVSSGNQEIFLCDSCPENFRTESQLQKHFRAKHDHQNTTVTTKTKNNQNMNGASNRLPANKPDQQVKETGKFECEICSVKFMKVNDYYVTVTSRVGTTLYRDQRFFEIFSLVQLDRSLTSMGSSVISASYLGLPLENQR